FFKKTIFPPASPDSYKIIRKHVSTILIIDDHEVVAESLAYLLNGEGFDTLVTRSGREGLEAIENHQPDLVICDYAMPGMTGLDVLKVLREHPRLSKTPFIMLTMYRELDESSKKARADAYLSKTNALDSLLTTVYDLVNKKKDNGATA